MRDLNTFLSLVEPFLTDLNVTQRARILSELSSELADKDLALQDPKTIANQKRIELGLGTYIEKKQHSFARFLVKSMVIMSLIFAALIIFLVLKFTPVFKIDEENERVTFFGGLIDIDGKAGKLKIGSDIQFTDAKYTNSFDLELDVAPSVQNINFDLASGNFDISTHPTSKLNLRCKLSTPPLSNIIQEKAQTISINLSRYQGSCDIQLPKNKFINLEAEQATINLLEPEFNTLIDLENGGLNIKPKADIAYDFQLSVETGFISPFESMGSSAEYTIEAKVENGSIIKQEN